MKSRLLQKNAAHPTYEEVVASPTEAVNLQHGANQTAIDALHAHMREAGMRGLGPLPPEQKKAKDTIALALQALRDSSDTLELCRRVIEQLKYDKVVSPEEQERFADSL